MGKTQNIIFRNIISAALTLCMAVTALPYLSLPAQADDGSAFGVVSTTPAKSDPPIQGVALNTGIEFVFNRKNVDISGSFKITPEVEGKFLTYETRSVFVPTKNLEASNIYKITLSGALKAPDGSSLGKSYSFSFKTAEAAPQIKPALILNIMNDRAETFLSSDPVTLAIYSNGKKTKGDYLAQAFRLTEQEYLEEIKKAYSEEKDDGLNPIKISRISDRKPEYETKSPLMPNLVWGKSEYYGTQKRYSSGIAFPVTFKEGYYAVEVSAVDEKTGQTVWARKLVQINDMAAYSLSVDTSATVWVNSAKTGAVFDSATVELVDAGSKMVLGQGLTNGEGLAKFRYSASQSANGLPVLLHIKSNKSGSPDFWEPVNLTGSRESSAKDKYMSYMHVDRRLYRNDDTVNVWGVVRGRYSQLPAGTRLVLTLSNYQSALRTTTVTLAGDGTFTANLSFTGLASDGYFVSLGEQGGNTDDPIALEYFYVANYQKPDYTYSAFAKKEFYRPGESITVGMQAATFDGTPAPGILATGPDDKAQRTNERGEITTVLPASKTNWVNDTWEPQNIYFDYTTNEGGWANGNAVYFPSELIMQAELDEKTGRSITVKTNALDLSGIKSREEIYNNYPNAFTGKAVDTNVSIKIVKASNVPVKEHTKTYYSWLDKKQYSYKWYEYQWKEETIKSDSVSTKNGTFKLDLPSSIWSDKDNNWFYYYVEVTAKDKNGYKVTESFCVNSSYRIANRRVNPIQGYYFTRVNNAGAQVDSPSYMKAPYRYSYITAGFGDKVEMKLNSDLPDSSKGKMFYCVVTDKVVESAVTQNRSFALTQAEKYAPNANILGAYFDGKHIYTIASSSMTLDTTNLELEVKAETTPTAVKPGGSSKISVEIKDKAGNPIQCAYNIAVVDKALLALADKALENPLSSLYSWRYYDYSVNTSYNQYKSDSGDPDDEDSVEEEANANANPGTAGGGGPDTIYTRKNFKDTAQFVSGVTGTDGKAVVDVSMPDNITSWRVGVVAIATGSNKAGFTEAAIITTQPMFLQIDAGSGYTPTEEAGVALRVRGTGIAESTQINYHIELFSNGKLLSSQDKKGNAAIKTSVNFGRLAAGDYQLIATGSTAGAADRAELAFTVSAENYILAPISKQITLNGENTALGIKPSRYPVTVGFADNRYAAYLEASSRLFDCRLRNVRDVLSAAAAAGFNKNFTTEAVWQSEYLPKDIGSYLASASGGKGVALYGYDSPDVVLTAFAAMLAPDKIPAEAKNDIYNYLQYAANYSAKDDERSAALMGLAALGGKVGNDVQARIAHLGDKITVNSAAYLCAALAILGDDAGSKALFDKRFTPIIKDNGSVAINEKGDAKIYETNLAALIAASSAKSPTAKALANYVMNGSSRYSSPDLHLAWFVKNFRDENPGSVQFQYRKDGQLFTQTLDKGGLKYINFSQADLNNPMFKATGGEVTAFVSYIGDIDEIAKQTPKSQSGLVVLEKTIRRSQASDFKNDGVTNGSVSKEILDNSYTIVYKVRLKEGAQRGSYTINDRIPSALRYYSLSQRYITGDNKQSPFVYHGLENQQITLNYYNSNYDKKDVEIEILITCQSVYDAQWGSAPAVIEHDGSATMWLSRTKTENK